MAAVDAAGNEGAKSPEANATSVDNAPPAGSEMPVSYVICDELPRHRPYNHGVRLPAQLPRFSDVHAGTPSQLHVPADVTACTPCHNASLTIEHNGRTTGRRHRHRLRHLPRQRRPARQGRDHGQELGLLGVSRQRRPLGHARLRDVDHAAAGPTGLVCGDCHDADIQVEHAKPTASSAAAGCSSCHPTPRDTLTTAWDKGCVQAGCHAHRHPRPRCTPAPPRPTRRFPRNASCFGTGCHSGTDLCAIHASADDHRRR